VNLQGLEAQLHRALESREVIALAQGITMSRVGGTPAQAYSVLRDAGLRTRRSLLEVCLSVVASGSGSATPTPTSVGEHEPDLR
jgi:AmiR/NasT family two-component response regulator